MKGNYIKEIEVTLLLRNKIKPEQTEEFIKLLVDKIRMNLVFIKTILLPPSFEIFTCIKESHIIFSYWKEVDYVRMIISSCKNYNTKKTLNFIENHFKPNRIKMRIIKDNSITKEITGLCQKIPGN